MTEWELEGHDAPCGGPDPRVSLLPLRREHVSGWRHLHGLRCHVCEVLKPWETRPLWRDHGGRYPRLP